MRRFLTEFTGEDGSAWTGPIILADSLDMAEALKLCLQGPGGESLRILGEVILSIPAENPADNLVSLKPVRRAN